MIEHRAALFKASARPQWHNAKVGCVTELAKESL